MSLNPINNCALAHQPSRYFLAKQFSHEMLRRIYRIAKLSEEIKEEAKTYASPFLKELKIRLCTQIFHKDEELANVHATGFIGLNPLAIEDAIEEGTLREQMTLIYCSLWNLREIFSDMQVTARINEQLKGDFELNIQLITSQQKLFKKPEFIREFQSGGGRLKRNPDTPPILLNAIENLTLREARAGLEDFIPEDIFNNRNTKLANTCIHWIPGKDYYTLDPENEFCKKAVASNLDVFAGPSSTADSFLQGCDYLNMAEFKERALLALIEWLVPAKDHSVHEILSVAPGHGIPYQSMASP